MPAEATAWTATLAVVGASGVDVARLDTAVAHADIDAHPPGAHGPSHDRPVFPQVPWGMPDDGSDTPMLAACCACWFAYADCPAVEAVMPRMDPIA